MQQSNEATDRGRYWHSWHARGRRATRRRSKFLRLHNLVHPHTTLIRRTTLSVRTTQLVVGACAYVPVVAKKTRQYRKGTPDCYERNQGILERGTGAKRSKCVLIVSKKASLITYERRLFIASRPRYIRLRFYPQKAPMSVGAVEVFPSLCVAFGLR